MRGIAFTAHRTPRPMVLWSGRYSHSSYRPQVFVRRQRPAGGMK